MIIDYTYFIGDINIAQISQATVMSNLETYINKYEPRFLKQLLGLGFYQLFLDGIDPISGAEQRWLDLLNGIVYEYQGKEFEWIGFQNSSKESSIANYVYYYYATKQVQQTVGIGEVQPKAENAAMASATPKLVRAWNEMVKWNYSLVEYLHRNRDMYPEWKPYCDDGLEYQDLYLWPEIFRKQNTLGI